MPDRKYDEGDYSFVPNDPPVAPEMQRNLDKAAENPGTWCRLVTYTKAGTASTTASHLRRGSRWPDRAEGTWEFVAEAVENGKFAVKAKFTPPT